MKGNWKNLIVIIIGIVILRIFFCAFIFNGVKE